MIKLIDEDEIFEKKNNLKGFIMWLIFTQVKEDKIKVFAIKYVFRPFLKHPVTLHHWHCYIRFYYKFAIKNEAT